MPLSKKDPCLIIETTPPSRPNWQLLTKILGKSKKGLESFKLFSFLLDQQWFVHCILFKFQVQSMDGLAL